MNHKNKFTLYVGKRFCRHYILIFLLNDLWRKSIRNQEDCIQLIGMFWQGAKLLLDLQAGCYQIMGNYICVIKCEFLHFVIGNFIEAMEEPKSKAHCAFIFYSSLLIHDIVIFYEASWIAQAKNFVRHWAPRSYWAKWCGSKDINAIKFYCDFSLEWNIPRFSLAPRYSIFLHQALIRTVSRRCKHATKPYNFGIHFWDLLARSFKSKKYVKIKAFIQVFSLSKFF